jgi:tRNA A-37 threonylcarbamoyl transferase component Bud32
VTSLPRLRHERIGELFWTTRADQPPTWWRTILADPEAWLQDPSRHLKNSRNVTLARIPSPEPGHPGLVLRRLNYGRWRGRLRDFFRRSRAQRALRSALAFESAGLPVARGLAAADLRWWRWPRHAYLLSTEIQDARTLSAIARASAPWSRRLVGVLAVLLARVHEAGFVHGDLKATNILFAPGDDPWLIDLDGVRQFERVPRRRAVEDLARLATGIIEAGGKGSFILSVRFMRCYCSNRGVDDWREWWSLVTLQVTRTLRETSRL